MKKTLCVSSVFISVFYLQQIGAENPQLQKVIDVLDAIKAKASSVGLLC